AYKDVSKLLNQTEANAEDQSVDAESTLSYVPNRNATLSMFVAGLAEMEQCDTVAFGAQQMDAVYPDNTPDFVNAMDKALKFSLNWHTNIKFAAPLVHLMKHEIIQLAIDLGVPLKDVTSCYYPKILSNTPTGIYNPDSFEKISLKGDIKVCGKCGPCQVRDATFKMLGVNDPQKGGITEGRRDSNTYDKFIESYVRPFV
ncbi:MAG: 7-cyano-7-deazaguanine synthase, partial [Nitrososphaeraceae archaeon]|nr:7-cyano-7-deazaguanine synthase [Nitrososphaeraceae archaeon]